MVQDAKRFILNNRAIIEKAPLQTYAAALVFSPRKSLVRGSYSTQFPTWVQGYPAVEDYWSSCLQTLEGHDDMVSAVAFSHDGKQLASGSYDNTVRLWNPATGTLQSTLKGHDGTVNAVAFSQDGKQFASGSYDKTVRLWDPATGTLLETFDISTVTELSFSADGSYIS